MIPTLHAAPASTVSHAPLLSALKGWPVTPPPIWLMRQAGRYLPEYRQIRDKARDFLDLCYTPRLAAEVTLQPIRRFGFDAAILFSDILVVPDALGQKVVFEDGAGPRLEPISSAAGLAALKPEAAEARFAPVYETAERVRAALPPEIALIGFCGAPWTVATYMIAGCATPDQQAARLWAYRDPGGFAALIDLLTGLSISYLSGQIAAGAQAVQIFDSWAGVLPDDEFRRWVIEPAAAIVRGVRGQHPAAPIIGFPRGAGPLYSAYVKGAKVDALSCDTGLALAWIKDELQPQAAVQGNLDPVLLLAGGEALEKRVRQIMGALSGGPFIFNLGHGILPQTPVEHVGRLVKLLRSASL